MGDSFPAGAKPPRIRLRARGSKPIVRIELVRNNRYVYARDYMDSEMERDLRVRGSGCAAGVLLCAGDAGGRRMGVELADLGGLSPVAQ